MNEFVEHLKDIEVEISDERGPFILFALFLREDSPDRWDLVVPIFIAIALFCSNPEHSGGGPDILIADFESPTYGEWVATGEAFGPGPAQGALQGQMAVSGFHGHGLVNSFYKGDASIGTLTS